MHDSGSSNATTTFRATVDGTGADGQPRVRLCGMLDASVSAQLSDELTGHLQQGTNRIYLDLREVPMITSAGVGALVAAIGDYREAGGDITLCGMNSDVRHVFELLALLSYVTYED